GAAKAGATVAGAGAGAAVAAAGSAAQAGSNSMSLDYFTDALLRPDDPALASGQTDVRREVSRILGRSLANGEISEPDQTYLVKRIAQPTGMDEVAAQPRLTQVPDQARQAAQQAHQQA